MAATIAGVLAHRDAWDGHMGWGGGWWMLIWGTLMMAGLVVLVVWLIRTTTTTTATGSGVTHRSAGEDPLASARRILAERYARGSCRPRNTESASTS